MSKQYIIYLNGTDRLSAYPMYVLREGTSKQKADQIVGMLQDCINQKDADEIHRILVEWEKGGREGQLITPHWFILEEIEVFNV